MRAMVEGADGKSKPQRVHLQLLAKQGHADSKAILEREPEFPTGMQHVWECYEELTRGRRYGVNGAEPISYADIFAWSRLTRRTLDAHEVEAILSIDGVMLHPGPIKPPGEDG